MLPINLLFSVGKGLFSTWNGHRKAKADAIKTNELAELVRGKQTKTKWQVAFDLIVFFTVFGPLLGMLFSIISKNEELKLGFISYFNEIGMLNSEYWYLSITVLTLIYSGRAANMIMKGKK